MHVIDQDAVEHDIEGQAGQKVMEILRELDYGVTAICGGTCACATCHVYVDLRWLAKLPKITEYEGELLSSLLNRKPESRLSCQIDFTEELTGLSVTIAPDE